MELKLAGNIFVKISYIKFYPNLMVTFSLHIGKQTGKLT